MLSTGKFYNYIRRYRDILTMKDIHAMILSLINNCVSKKEAVQFKIIKQIL